jgi:hypothetical protein
MLIAPNPTRAFAPREALWNGTSTVLRTTLTTELRDDTQVFGGVLAPYEWLVDYEADALPQNDAVPWTETLEAPVSAAVASGALSVVNVAGNAAWRFWELPVPSLDDAVGTWLQAQVRVTADVAGVNQGMVLAIFDGTYQYLAWLRADGVNLDGEADVAVDMTDWRRVTFLAQGGRCWLLVDGEQVQVSLQKATTAALEVAFGTWIDEGMASPSASLSPSTSPSPSPSESPSPSISPSGSPSLSPSESPSISPSASVSPSISPSSSPSAAQSGSPSVSPSLSPSISPSRSPSVSPSHSPSVSPSVSSSASPSAPTTRTAASVTFDLDWLRCRAMYDYEAPAPGTG